MATEIPSGNTPFTIDEDDTTYLLKKTSTLTISGSDTAIFAGATTSGDTLNLLGVINQNSSAFAAVSLSGSNHTVNVGAAAGKITSNTAAIELNGSDHTVNNFGTLTTTDMGGYGIFFESDDTHINNTGNISANGTAIFAHGDNAIIDNNGQLNGARGIEIGSGDATINLLGNSLVNTTEHGIFSEGDDSDSRIKITNEGTIEGGSGFAIETASSKDTVINRGIIHGKIQLGDGADIFDNRGGTVDHFIQGGTGDDTLITSKAGTKLKEDGGSAGFDTVKSSVGYTLSENVEQLLLIGKADVNGKGTADGNWLIGNKGDNKLTGVDGSGSDTFIFKTKGGHDTLMDFDSGIDHIDVDKWQGMDDIQDIKSHAQNVGDDVRITLGDDQLIIQDLHKNQLKAGDFIFDPIF
jgi:hypothetical protein